MSTYTPFLHITSPARTHSDAHAHTNGPRCNVANDAAARRLMMLSAGATTGGEEGSSPDNPARGGASRLPNVIHLADYSV